jgi:predicted nucleotidyltransferase
MSAEFMRLEDPSLEAMVLFGSRSRGDPDMNSDTDLALFARADSADELVQLRSRIMQIEPLDLRNMSVYSLRTAEEMARHGSLFLWHLKLEGRVLFKRSNWIDELMSELHEYSPLKAERDLRTFEYVLEDIRDSIKSTRTTLEFELATLYSVLRNLGMIVTALSGSPCFGRIEPILKTKTSMGSTFRLTDREIRSLLRIRLMYSRNAPTNDTEIIDTFPEELWEKVSDVAVFVRRIIDERIC